jgi:hypothetical protein
MNHFSMHETDIAVLLEKIIQSPPLHAKWLNTLSYLENCGARKIARCQHPTKVKEEVLKHAAEEFRHALFLKEQISKTAHFLPDYRIEMLLGGKAALHYIHALDISICRRLLYEYEIQPLRLKEYAYLLVTYAIELRAFELYPLYEDLLRKYRVPIYVKCVILEEQEHLEEMKRELSFFPNYTTLMDMARNVEHNLYRSWVDHLHKDLLNF